MGDTSPPCTICDQPHISRYNAPACVGHVFTDRASYVPGQPRKILEGKPLPCRKPPAKGLTVCHQHGAKRRDTENYGRRKVAEQQAQKQLAAALRDAYGDDVPDVPPAEAMLRAVSWTYAEVVVLRRKVAELGEDARVWGVTREKTGGEDRGVTEEARPNIWWTMLRESMRDLVKFAAAARAAGCDEARVKLAEQQGALLADVIRGILGDLNLTTEQQQLVSTVVPRHLRSVAG